MTRSEYLAPYLPQTCSEEGHVDGCPGKAGGDHELDSTPDPSWEEDEDGFIVEPLQNRGTLDA
jgi:hypothetical protein